MIYPKKYTIIVYLNAVHKRMHTETLYVIAKSQNQHKYSSIESSFVNYYLFIQKNSSQ